MTMFDYENFSVRPFQMDDLELVLNWRNQDRIRENMYNDHLISEEEHKKWFLRAISDVDNSYLIFLYCQKPVGVITFTNVNVNDSRCYWAFYLGDESVPRGTGSAMEFFALDFAFNTLKIRKLCCEVLGFNKGVIKLHNKFGFNVEGKFIEHHFKNSKYVDVVCLAKFRESWVVEREEVMNRIFKTSAK